MQDQAVLLSETRTIAGTEVSQGRGRYEWDNGCRMEIEITDTGFNASEDVFAALGFNLQMTNKTDGAGFVVVNDHDGMLVNHEYDYQDASGSIQLILKGRILVEIQLQQLPAESFQQIIDEQISLTALVDIAGPSEHPMYR